MTDLQALFTQLDALSPEEFAQVRAYFEQKQVIESSKPSPSELEAWMNALDQAIDEFREGLTEKQLEELLLAMSYKSRDHVADLRMFDWLDDLPEEAR